MTTTATDRLNASTSSNGIKAPVRVATTASITLSGLQTIDGVTVATGDRVLVKNQSTASQNGIYVADTSDWERAPDFDGTRDAVKGTLVYVSSGSLNVNTFWSVTTSDPITIGTTSISFSATPTLSGALLAANNLSDLTSTSTARTNLGLGTAATSASSSFAASSVTISASGLATGGGSLTTNRTVTVTAATQSDMEAASSTTTAVTPSVVRHHPGVAKAWVLFTSDGTITASYNVTSVTKNSTGDYTVTFTTAFSSANYVAFGMAQSDATWGYKPGGTKSTTACQLVSKDLGGTLVDVVSGSLVFFGDQ